MVNTATKTEYKCPICQSFLVSLAGSVMRKDGVTLWCESKDCTAQEVMGYERNEERAFEIITQKYKK